MSYYLKVFGCQMNQSDAERIATILRKYKIKPAASIDEADFVIFVTCGVRQSAEDRVYGQINNLRKNYPAKYIILTGCLAHRRDVQRRLKGKVDLFAITKDFPKNFVSSIKYNVLSINKKYKIHNTLYSIHNTKTKPYNDYLKITPRYANSHTAYVPIMTGCNNFCAYCVVPYARGSEYSRPVEDILKEVKSLIKKGYKEIFLLGQNVNSYCHPEQMLLGRCEGPREQQVTCGDGIPRSARNDNVDFPCLLRLIEKIPGHFWITFLTSHPKDMSDELIETIAKSLSASGGQKICEYISLPAQSGDNKILRKMNRHYTVSHYKNLIKKIRRASLRLSLGDPQGLALGKLEPSVSTDIIVGFPGETKKQFENTAKLMQEMKFDMAYIAQYSPRPETAAWKLKDNVSKKEKVRREKVLTDILAKSALENNKKYIGKVVEVLVDQILRLSLRKPEGLALGKYKYSSHTRTQKKVIFYSNKQNIVGKFVKVKITKAKTFGLEGKMK